MDVLIWWSTGPTSNTILSFENCSHLKRIPIWHLSIGLIRLAMIYVLRSMYGESVHHIPNVYDQVYHVFFTPVSVCLHDLTLSRQINVSSDHTNMKISLSHFICFSCKPMIWKAFVPNTEWYMLILWAFCVQIVISR